MERLTYRDTTKWAHAERDCRVFDDTDANDNECYSGDLIDRLALYEDTGLTPEEISDFVIWLNEDREELNDLTLFNDIGELARYRETGFTPEKISKLQKKFDRLSSKYKELMKNYKELDQALAEYQDV